MGDGDLYSVRLMRSALMPRVHPGRGLVVDAGGGQGSVQVPLAPLTGCCDPRQIRDKPKERRPRTPDTTRAASRADLGTPLVDAAGRYLL